MIATPDRKDPFGPPKNAVRVYCLHCGETYMSNEIARNPDVKLWVCKNYPQCDGAGYGFDIMNAENFEA